MSTPAGAAIGDTTGGGLAVSLREVTRRNLDALLRMDAGDGGRQVASNARSMAQSAVYGEAWPRAIYAGDEPVGFLMLNDPSLVADPEERELCLWRLMIDQAHQRRGLGRAAMQLLIAHARSRPHQGEMITSIVEPAPHLLVFYGSLGFVATDRIESGERVLRLVF